MITEKYEPFLLILKVTVKFDVFDIHICVCNEIYYTMTKEGNEICNFLVKEYEGMKSMNEAQYFP